VGQQAVGVEGVREEILNYQRLGSLGDLSAWRLLARYRGVVDTNTRLEPLPIMIRERNCSPSTCSLNELAAISLLTR
jgi:hypothetical protein